MYKIIEPKIFRENIVIRFNKLLEDNIDLISLLSRHIILYLYGRLVRRWNLKHIYWYSYGYVDVNHSLGDCYLYFCF